MLLTEHTLSLSALTHLITEGGREGGGGAVTERVDKGREGAGIIRY